MFLLLDEHCAKALVRTAEALGHTAQRTTDIAELGQGARDPEIFAFAQRHGAVLVTINARDFMAIAGKQPDHNGLFLLPQLPVARLRSVFADLLRVAEPLSLARGGFVLNASSDGVVRVRRSGPEGA